MHIHILGICGTFMGGIAALARAAGHRVTGCDANVYPPMSDQLRELGIELTEGYDKDQIRLMPDIFVVGNTIKRGTPLLEAILDQNLPCVSGPQWLAEHVLRGKWVLGVAGTHGKTTTTALLSWILEYAGLNPGFLVGGIPKNFGVSARLTESPFFVIEADEYDTAFCDKRSKFIHYRPKTTILNNLEFDHADIFSNLEAIETQFHHLVRTLPSQGLIIANSAYPALDRVIERGAWTPVSWINTVQGWQIQGQDRTGELEIFENGTSRGKGEWSLQGDHNRSNALAALLAARHAGVPLHHGLEALSRFENVKRRMELRGQVRDISVYDDFAHHPTAIALTIAGLRAKIGDEHRIVAVLEPRSNTMKLGTMKEQLPGSLSQADRVFCYAGQLSWAPQEALLPLADKACVHDDLSVMIEQIVQEARPNDHILVMSNGGFGGIHDKILGRLTGQLAG